MSQYFPGKYATGWACSIASMFTQCLLAAHAACNEMYNLGLPRCFGGIFIFQGSLSVPINMQTEYGSRCISLHSRWEMGVIQGPALVLISVELVSSWKPFSASTNELHRTAEYSLYIPTRKYLRIQVYLNTLSAE